ncbi:Down syndrome cell adhesion molecule-like [Argiope bruennichi]|uniref:Down syndrome cell adhesion molecule-like n=1 Tax=Argiope bruennichi TaxID=94029 RepID=A0A8T0FDY2_ARGBR|nr:Down syndrome cell adhesion molecule-like [Argiope bruennichi]
MKENTKTNFPAVIQDGHKVCFHSLMEYAVKNFKEQREITFDSYIVSGMGKMDVPPSVISVFPEQTAHPGGSASLKCTATGNPPPRVTWYLDGSIIGRTGRISIGDYITEHAHVVSFLNITDVRVEDGGEYKCQVSNDVGSTSHSARLNVYGPTFVRPMPNVTAISGEDLMVRCPYGGYPIKAVRWFKVPPQFTVEPKNSTVVLGNTVWLDCAAVGFPAPSILWKKLIYTENTAGDFTYVHSSPRAHRYNNGTLVISDAEESDAGAYLCQANNGIGAGLSKIVSLQVLVPPRFKESFQSRATREGLNATLKCDATGHAPITITWQKNKTTLDSKSNKSKDGPSRISNNNRIPEKIHQLKYHRHYVIKGQIMLKNHRGVPERDINAENFKRNNLSSILLLCALEEVYRKTTSKMPEFTMSLPDAPSNLTVLNTTSRSVSLFWEVAHNGNSHITGSIVQYQTVSDSHWNGQTSQLIVSGAENSATLRALTPVTLYFVRVIAENALGQSRPSAVINVTTEEEAPSGSPREVQVHSTGAQSIKVMWKPPSEETQHGHIKGYYIGYRISNSPENYVFKQVESNSEKEQQSTYITGLQPFTKYDIVVKAYNSAGAGPKSSKITGKTLETAPPTSPIVQIEGTTSSTIDISWKKDIKDKSAIPEYTIHYKSDDGEWKSEQLGSNVDRYTITGLKCGSRYQLYMTASNSLGTGEPSSPVFARTQGAAPMSPQESVFLQPNATSVSLHLSAWKNGGCPITHFVVQHRPKYQNQWITANEKLDMPREVYTIRHLAPEREYVIMVTAHSEAGLTQGEYGVKTLPASAIAFGKRETGLPFYKNVALVVPVVVSSLVILVLLFAIVVCFRKHSQDRRGRHDYDNRKPVGDSLMMSDMTKQLPAKSTKFSHYTCPAGKTDYAEPYTCNDSAASRQGSDGLFATIKRCPTRPIYMSASYKQDISTNGQLSTPGKHRKRPETRNAILDNFDLCVLRNIVNEFYANNKIPSLSRLLPVVKERINFPWKRGTLWKYLHIAGFQYKRCRNQRQILIERSHIVAWRFRFLRKMKKFREAKRNIVYIDETWLDSNLSFEKCWRDEKIGAAIKDSSGRRLIVVHAGSESGFVPNAGLIFKAGSATGDYHGQMNSDNLKKWIVEKLLPNIPTNSVIVMDNAAYHTKVMDPVPTKSSKKDKMCACLEKKQIPSLQPATTAYNPRGNGGERYNNIIWKMVLLTLKSKSMETERWEEVLQPALHSIRSLLCTAANAILHECMFNHPRELLMVVPWLYGQFLMKNHVRHTKYDPVMQEVELIEANPDYAHVKLPDGRNQMFLLDI